MSSSPNSKRDASRAKDVTTLLVAWGRGDQAALDCLLPVVYADLRGMARRYLHSERPDHTFTPTALVHEAFLRLVQQREVNWQNRAQFFGIAAQLMRRILVDYARRQRASKRGSGVRAAVLDDMPPLLTERGVSLLDIDVALAKLEKMDARQARIVELRFFGGLTFEEAAQVLGLSATTVRREFAAARAWLYRELQEGVTSWTPIAGSA